MLETNYQALIAEQRDAYLIALDCLAREASSAAIKRAITALKTDKWWRDSGNETRCDYGARELTALLESVK